MGHGHGVGTAEGREAPGGAGMPPGGDREVEEAAGDLAQAVLESANAVILNFTRPVVQAGEHLGDEEKLPFLKDMVKNNPRLVRSCVAFQDDSPIMQGLKRR